MQDLELKHKLPNFFVVGAAKAGTTSIYNYIKLHPEVYVSLIKEPNFFSTDIDVSKFRKTYKKEIELGYEQFYKYGTQAHLTFIRSWEDYYKLFENVKNEKAIGEFSTSYLYSKIAAKNIYNNIENAKIIIVLRNPIERAFSHYIMDLKIGYTNLSFMEAIKKDMNAKEKGWGITSLYLELGEYYEQVKRYLDIFPKESVKIYLFEDLKNTKNLILDLYEFLNVNPDLYFPDVSQKFNRGKIPKSKTLFYFATKIGFINLGRKIMPSYIKNKFKKLLFSEKSLPRLTDNEKKFLISYYEKDVKKLSELIERDLSSWLKV